MAEINLYSEEYEQELHQTVDWNGVVIYDMFITFSASAEYTYTKGKNYMPNGDPGYPAEFEFEVTGAIIESIELVDTEGNGYILKETDDNYKEWFDLATTAVECYVSSKECYDNKWEKLIWG